MAAAADGADGPGAQLAPAIALSSLLAIAAFLAIAPILRSIVPLTDLPAPLPDHHQDAETLLFVLAYAVLLPLGIWAGSRIAARISAGANADSFSGLAAALTGLLAIVLIVARLSSEVVLSAAAAVWLLLAAALLSRAAAPVRRPFADALAAHAGALWIGAGVLALCTALTFTTLDSISVPVLVLGLLAIAAFLVLRERVSPPALPRPLGLAADAAAVVLLAFAIPNLAIFVAGGGTEGAVQNSIIQFHQNFFLGPANQILAGDAMLVDTLSQYGVGSIYFLAGAFTVIPISNQSLGLIEGLLSVVMFAGAWATMRIAGVSRLLAAVTMVVAVVALVYGLQYPLGGLLQHGAIRFGLPIGVVVGAVAEARWPQAATPARLLQLATVALASIWALEAFAYTVLTVLAVVAVTVWMAPAGTRRRALVSWIVQLLAACVVAHLLLAAITLIATGELPDWGWYLNTLREFLFGQIGDLTYDFSAWSPALAVGGLYLVSAVALVLIVRGRPRIVDSQRTMIVAIAAMTAFGIALFTYIVNRSADHIIPYVCLPAVTLGALWLTFLGRPALAVGRAGQGAGWGIALGLAALLVSVASSSVDTRFHESALAYARPGGASLKAALDRIWDPPPVRPAAAEGSQLLETYMPGESRSSVLTSADLSVEILIRADRGSAVPLGDPWEDSFVPDDHIENLAEYVDGLEAGDRLLLDQPAQEAFDAYRADPERDPLETPAGGVTLIPSGLATLQEWVLREIGKTWDLKKIGTSPSGLEVVELVPRDPGAASEDAD